MAASSCTRLTTPYGGLSSRSSMERSDTRAESQGLVEPPIATWTPGAGPGRRMNVASSSSSAWNVDALAAELKRACGKPTAMRQVMERNRYCSCRASAYNMGQLSWPMAAEPATIKAAGGVQWESSCATLSSQWATQLQAEAEAEAEAEEQVTATMTATATTTTTEVGLQQQVQLPKPLTVWQQQQQQRAQLQGQGQAEQLRVAYQGVPGAYSEAAAGKAYPDSEAVPCEQFEAAFQAVELWLVDRAVLPIENSIGGSIHRNYDLLLRHRLHIVGEVQLAVHHCLLGLPGVTADQLRRVVSHPQALAQCEHSLTALLPHSHAVVREAFHDTAAAAQLVAAGRLRDTAAIASARAAHIYGLHVLADGLQDDAGNVTRFLMLAREPIIPRNDRPFKTSIVFTLHETPGVLFKALSCFSLRGINLTKIESRPQRNRPLRVVDHSNHGSARCFDYLFYVDFEASMADLRAQNALGQLQEFSTFLRVLGSYPQDTTLPIMSSGPQAHSH